MFELAQWLQIRDLEDHGAAGDLTGSGAAVLSAGTTETLSGFKSKAGNDFEAKLKVIAGEVKFDFS